MNQINFDISPIVQLLAENNALLKTILNLEAQKISESSDITFEEAIQSLDSTYQELLKMVVDEYTARFPQLKQ